MAIIRKLVAQDDNDDNQWLMVDHDSSYVVNDADDWQFLFGPNSALSKSLQNIKIAAEFNKDTLDSIRLVSYLYDPITASVDNAASAVFNISLVTSPNWSDTFIASFNGLAQSNQYFFVDIPLSSLPQINFFGGDTIMIEATIIRLGVAYRDRIYINHLGIFDNAFRLRQDVDFLDLTKVDE